MRNSAISRNRTSVTIGVPRDGTYWGLASVDNLNLQPREVKSNATVPAERLDAAVTAADGAILLLKVGLAARAAGGSSVCVGGVVMDSPGPGGACTMCHHPCSETTPCVPPSPSAIPLALKPPRVCPHPLVQPLWL